MKRFETKYANNIRVSYT